MYVASCVIFALWSLFYECWCPHFSYHEVIYYVKKFLSYQLVYFVWVIHYLVIFDEFYCEGPLFTKQGDGGVCIFLYWFAFPFLSLLCFGLLSFISTLSFRGHVFAITLITLVFLWKANKAIFSTGATLLLQMTCTAG